jgi:hypothetical protein
MKSNNKKSRKNQARPNKTTEKRKPEPERLDYPYERELELSSGDIEPSYSEQVDVTPPRPHEFPSFGNAKGDFVSRKLGRKTGRMIGHEPGTEGL